MPAPPLSVLCGLNRIYGLSSSSTDANAPSTASLSLSKLSTDFGVPVSRPPAEALVLIVGDAGSGKSAFVNALAQEIVLPVASSSGSRSRSRALVSCVRSDAALTNSLPRTVETAMERFPNWKATPFVGYSASSRLDGVDLVEAVFPSDANDLDALTWLASRADVVVCLMDSQKTPMVSEELLQFMQGLSSTASVAGSDKADAAESKSQPALQFVLSKADLLTREAERVRVRAKASKAVTERIGRGYEVLPVATGDLTSLLKGLGSDGLLTDDAASTVLTVGGQEFVMPAAATDTDSPSSKYEDGPLRALKAAQERAGRRVAEGLASTQKDCEALVAAIGGRVADASATSSPKSLKNICFQGGGAMGIVAALVPYVLDVEVEVWIVQMWSGGAAALAFLLLLVALLLPSGAAAAEKTREKPQTLAGLQLAALSEQERFAHLVLRQCALWSGEDLVGTDPALPNAATPDTSRRKAD